VGVDERGDAGELVGGGCMEGIGEWVGGSVGVGLGGVMGVDSSCGDGIGGGTGGDVGCGGFVDVRCLLPSIFLTLFGLWFYLAIFCVHVIGLFCVG
jgi:hypothetical protein